MSLSDSFLAETEVGFIVNSLFDLDEKHTVGERCYAYDLLKNVPQRFGSTHVEV